MKKPEKRLSVVIASTEKVIWSGIAMSLSSTNTEGPFDVLPEHANFITLINDKPIKVRTSDNKKLNFNFKKAIVFVHGDNIKVYAEE